MVDFTMFFAIDASGYLVNIDPKYGHKKIRTQGEKVRNLLIFDRGMAQEINQERARYMQENKKKIEKKELEEWAKKKIEDAYKLAHAEPDSDNEDDGFNIIPGGDFDVEL